MIWKQCKHPLTVMGVAFLIVTGTAVRLNEYTLSQWVEQMESPIKAMMQDNRKHPEKESGDNRANAADLYEKAHTLLAHMPSRGNTQYPWPDNLKWGFEGDPVSPGQFILPLPPKSLPEPMLSALEIYLLEQREVLDLLYEAANISYVRWSIERSPRKDYFRSWPWNRRILCILMWDALRQVIHHNEAGILRSITSLAAFLHAQEKIDPPRAPGRILYSHLPLDVLLIYGLELNVFGDSSLEILEEVFSEIEVWHKRIMLEDQVWRFICSHLSHLSWHGTWSGLGKGLEWYMFRYAARNSMKELFFTEAILNAFLQSTMEDIPRRYLDYVMSRLYSEMITSSHGLIPFPYTAAASLEYRMVDAPMWIRDYLRSFSAYQTQVKLVIIVALERYRRNRGVFPESLSELGLTYPPDNVVLPPWDTAFDYRRTEKGWQLGKLCFPVPRP